jgi:hypothetical protein
MQTEGSTKYACLFLMLSAAYLILKIMQAESGTK